MMRKDLITVGVLQCTPSKPAHYTNVIVDVFCPAQVQGALFKHTPDPAYISSVTVTESASAPSTFTRSTASHRNRRHHHRAASRPKVQRQTSLSSLPLACEDPDELEQWVDRCHPESWRAQWMGPQSGSLFSLPNLGSASSSQGPSASPHHRRCSLHGRPSLIPPFRLNVNALVGADETDVDTGHKVNPGSSVDLTVVSAYIKPSLPQTSRPSSAPPEDIGPSLLHGVPDSKAATLGWTPVQVRAKSISSKSMVGSHLQNINWSAAASLSDMSISSCSIVEEKRMVEEEEDEQEFYI